ncbi:MAG: hypothetical protein ACI8X5_002747, partial [Planctomycetota bacterium]
MLRSAWFIARYDLAYMLKQKETLLWVFVMPFIFFYFIGTVTGGASSSMGLTSTKPVPLALMAPEDGGFLLEELLVALEEQNFAVVRVSDETEMELYTRRLYIP